MRTRFKTLLPVALLLPLVTALLTVAPTEAAPARLTNGCTHSARGIPSCGAYVGGAYGGNANVAPWEKYNGRKLGIHRTYFGPNSANSALKTAKNDVANKRVPWMSFKAPHSWSAMASGKGDAWAKNLATKLKSAGGPVWVAVHHEPEGDGDIQTWKKMQERLAPIMRKAAPNLGYTVIFMGYHQFHGAKKYSLANTWPKTKIDVAGFDIYEKYGAKGVKEWKQFGKHYFAPLKKWSAKTGVPWGLAETGYTDAAARKSPRRIVSIYNALKKYDGIAYSYFNTNLNSVANWKLSLAGKKKAFKALNRTGALRR
jgi:hypothetical protein